MKKILSLMALLAAVTHAQELHHSELATHSGVYFEPKLIYTFGEKVAHGESELDGDAGYGLGFDLGYSFNEYFALELDGTYSVADVTEKREGEVDVSDQGKFYSYGVNSVFTYPMSHHFILLGKLGYGYEHEDLGDLNIAGSEHGATWAAGVEYSFNPHIEVSFEYEGANIRTVRGHSLQLGLIYKF
jgi:opacity protein-like surface antigen